MLRHNFSSTSATATCTETLPEVAHMRTKKGTNWIRRALQGLPDFLHVVSLDGRIRFVSESCQAVVGHERDDLLGCRIFDFVHPDDLGVFAQELNGVFTYGNPVRFIYRFRNLANDWTILESQCNAYQDGELSNIAWHREVIIMARPYSSKTDTLFDSFLEHKIAYERLVQQKRQLVGTNEEVDVHQDDACTRVVDGVVVAYADPSRAEHGYVEPQVQVQVEFADLTPEEEPAVASKDLFDFDAASMQAKDATPVGDLGIPITRGILKQGNASRKKKKAMRKEKKQYICKTCGAVESPEWRKGPDGLKTLCNSCGLRWSKYKRAQKAK